MKNTDLTQGNIRKTLLAFALPYLGASLLQALYGAADLYVVGRFNGPSAISAVNIGSQIMQIITSFVIGCSMGCTVRIGNCIGRRDDSEAARTLSNTIFLFVALAAVLTPIMVGCASPIVTLMQTPTDAVAESIAYVRICAVGIPFIIAFNGIAAVLRGMGDSKTPLKVVTVACLINIGGDFALTGAFHMGVEGAAIATISAQLISSIYGIAAIRKHGLAFSFQRNDLTPDRKVICKIAAIGLPIAAQDTLINLSFILITVIANTRGLIASSAVGVVEKIIMFLFLVPSALLSSISAITAQNVGAGKSERAVQARNFGALIGMSFGCVMCLLSWLCPSVMTGIFTDNTDVIQQANAYLKTYSIDCILVGCVFSFNGYLNGIGKSLITFLHNTISIFLVRIPAAYFMSLWFPDSLLPMGLASPLGSLLSIGILALYFCFYLPRHPA